ncbi:MAG: glycoside hydrolase family 30 protein [Limisphaerales bacterium]
MKQTIIATISLLALMGAPAQGTSGHSTNHVEIYLTARDTGQKLAKAGETELVKGLPAVEQEECIFVDPSKTFQTVLGIGGALTDAAAETFYKLPEGKQQELLRAYFDPQAGIGYTLGRTSIHSCDFSSGSYTYVKDGDKQLDSFDIAHDLKYRIPFIKAAMAKAGHDFTLFASPWSPPGWMKDNGDMLHGGKLKPEYYESWARYYGRFIQAYEKEGIPVWGLTVQNEPLAKQTWESCIYTAEEERDFVKNYLGPALHKAGLQDKKIIIWDHNRSLMYERASVVLDDPAAAKYVWGVGFHWYMGDNFENVKRLKEAYPQTHLLFTEGCNYPFDFSKINDWQWGELYAKSMIHDFNNGAEGWTDWNVLLDEKGGPNHVQNFCFAPIHADTKTGDLWYMNSYYYIGHFSRFIRPGAKRIISSSTTDELLTTAFLNQDGKIAVVVLNLSDQAQPVSLWLGDKAARISSPAHSIITVVSLR